VVGAHDNFFELGCDSLRLIQVCARLRELFDLDLDPKLVFEAPTVAGLAARLREGPERGCPLEATAKRVLQLVSA
jgi:acyl carrier protein